MTASPRHARILGPHLEIAEIELARKLAQSAALSRAGRSRVMDRAAQFIGAMRERARQGSGIEHFLQEYRLSTGEGVALLSLAEALLRIPDTYTVDELIRDKLSSADWRAHFGRSSSILVNTSTLGLMLSQHLLQADGVLGRLLAAGGEPVVRRAMQSAMRIMAGQFVMGADIESAVQRAQADESGFRYSFDMLGEGARTAIDAERYFDAYASAIRYLGNLPWRGDAGDRPTISVKLSALHSRYEPAQTQRAVEMLTERLSALAHEARTANIGLTVDAEEADRLELSLVIIDAVARDALLGDWGGFGLAVQAYQKRAPAVIAWAHGLAQETRPLSVRLVKGAYWDTEIKRAQERGLDGYPVFTRKVATDVSYLACAKALLEARALRPAFATHNALTVATLLEWAGNRRDFEFQRLHGMGDGLYEPLLAQGYACRVYAPVGPHRDLLAYLVRRLLENGANTSFVHQLGEENADAVLLADPVAELERLEFTPHPRIPLPADLYLPQRKNSHGVDLADAEVVRELQAEIAREEQRSHHAFALVGGVAQRSDRQPIEVRDPADRRRTIGLCSEARPSDVDDAITVAAGAQERWSRESVEKRAEMLDRAADLIERNRASLMYFAIHEAGKTLPDAIAEVREAADFCRYYAACARASFKPMQLPGPTGESNELYLAGRGPFACISPWNFPLAIFTGQVAAALVTGNTVLAKPAPQTPLMAHHAVQLLHEAGVPPDVLHLLPGGVEVGRALAQDPRIRGVVFTGSTATARGIASTLASKDGPIVPLIAETGGQNAMIVDSSALPEQVIGDVLMSGFQSAGQRCSALRVLWLQDEIAPRVLEMLQGAMEEWVVGDPSHLRTDVGPTIDEHARDRLESYVQSGVGRVLHRMRLSDECEHGCFIAPTLLEMKSASDVVGEVFGPVVHVLRWSAQSLDAVIEAINRSGYGLTLGIHSRIGNTVEYIRERVRVGNIYVNRSMIGAVVGAQPFGGEGLSGTGPKAGGPHYLLRFATERTVSIDTTSAGGNATLMSEG